MRVLNALSLTRAIRDWLADTRHPRVLHRFDRACNLINERREVLSIVTPEIGDGPFNLVITEGICFGENLSSKSPVSSSINQLTLGNFIIHTANAKLWNPSPDWETLHAKRKDIPNYLAQLPITNYSSPILQSSNLFSALANADIPTAKILASQLAGLGIGLTPSGDDFIMGALYAAWIIHPPEIASILAWEVAETASALTTSLSAAWIRSAGRGEAGVLWHNLFHALNIGDSAAVRSAITKLLSVGHTSGADAMSGFIGVMTVYMEKELAAHENPSR
ncbi:MAG: hypothetical protein DPW18_01300 [Chloroflexi bacterium]|nr:hypothetical protein [Chloroflexota bacterium]MDL1940857.1 DUF2877 domain-containing protein [Chloroflexi bacterium CFX2]